MFIYMGFSGERFVMWVAVVGGGVIELTWKMEDEKMLQDLSINHAHHVNGHMAFVEVFKY